ncbi:MAG TPA: calcium/sodium antiporter [Bacteroidales bacterium]|nr:calcium/sodium antiporter [Bacteroidales bacterium]
MEKGILLIPGLIILLFCGEYLVRSSVAFASHMRISSLVVGLVVVSFGTSAPELFVSLDAAISGHPDISLGNVIGSNISNISIVLALTVIVMPYVVNTSELFKNWAIMVGVSILLFIFLYTGHEISRLEGIALLIILVAFILLSVISSRRELRKDNAVHLQPRFSLPVSILIILVSSAGLAFGADLLVKGATAVARLWGVSERVISVSVIALGTSLPELATSAVAALRKQREISIGNIIGSNIFNILAILGITSAVRKISVSSFAKFSTDIIWMIAVSVLLFLLILPMKGSRLGRWKGFVLASVYFVYIYILFFH